MKIKIVLLLIICTFVYACGSNNDDINLSNDTTFYVESISGKEVSNSKVYFTHQEWEELQSANLSDLLEYQIADKARLNIYLYDDTMEIVFIVTAEDGTKKTVNVKIEILSSDSSFSILSIDDLKVKDNTIWISNRQWESLKNSDLKAKTTYELADKAALEVSVDEENKQIIYTVIAEDKTTNSKVISVKFLSSDTSIQIYNINDFSVSNDFITLSKTEWNTLKTLDLKEYSEYILADKAMVKVAVENDQIIYTVTAEDGTTAAKVINVLLLSDDASVSILTIDGKSVVDNSVTMTISEWNAIKSTNIISLTTYETAEDAMLEVSVDEGNYEITYTVTAEDGTKNIVKIQVLVLEEIENTNVVLRSTAGNKVATSYWFAEYKEEGISITVDVVDSDISTGNSNYGMNDNVEFIIGLRGKKHTLSIDTDYKVLVDATGRYFFQKAVDLYNFGESSSTVHNAIGLIFGETFDCSTELKDYDLGFGYRVNIYIAYSILGLDKEIAYGELSICPAMRNTNNNGTEWVHFNQLDCVWAKNYTYVGIENDGTLVNNVKKYYNNVDYLFIGDSWMDVWFWPTFDTDFGDYNAINLGIGGTKGEDWVARLDVIKKFNPKNLILRIGTNDINVGGQTAEGVGNEIVGLCKLLHSHLPNMYIYFLSIDPCIGHAVHWNNGNDKIANSIVERFALETDYVTYQDFTEKLVDENNDLISSMYCADSCHLSTMGYATYVKVMYEMLGLGWNECSIFGDSGKFSHTLGFSIGNSNQTTNDAYGEQHIYFKDFSSLEFYAEFELTTHKVYNNDAWPKFGIRMSNGNLSHILYIDGLANLNGSYVGITSSVKHNSYDWNNKPTNDVYVNNLYYTNGSFVKLGVLRTNGVIYFFVNDVCTLSFKDNVSNTKMALGAFAFNTSITVRNGMVSDSVEVISEKLTLVK